MVEKCQIIWSDIFFGTDLAWHCLFDFLPLHHDKINPPIFFISERCSPR